MTPPTASTPNANNGAGRSYTGRNRTTYDYTPEYHDYATYQTRVRNYYAPYMGRPVVVFHDNFNSFFWLWLLDQSLDTRAQWAYHHRSSMDPARYDALVASDASLSTRVSQLEQSQAQVNPAFVPTGMERDLMYDDQYAHQVYRSASHSRLLFWFLAPPIILCVGAFTIWLLFIKKWNVN